MSLFISYGHEARILPLVHRVKQDLEAAGIPCWIDSEQLHKPGADDWRRALTEALHRCTWTLGFLTRHAMRPADPATGAPPGVCRTELAIAYEQLHGCLTTVLLEPLDGWEVPVMVGHTQWLDWSDRHAHLQPGDPDFEAWYQPRLDALKARLDPAIAARYRREVAYLERCLAPQIQRLEIEAKVEGFVGREWLERRVEDWRLGRTQERLLWLTGEPGSGKSAFSAWITHQHRCNVVALNLCDYRLHQERCDAAQVVRTLAFALACRVQDYRAQLLRTHPLPPDPADDEARATEVSLALKALVAASSFDALITQPLAHCFDGGRRNERLLLVVDGLDEAVQAAEHAALIDTLNEQGQKLPLYIGLLVTSRADTLIKSKLSALPMLRIEAEGAKNNEDLRIYAKAWLKGLKVEEPTLSQDVAQIVARSGGNFLYLRMLEAGHADGKVTYASGDFPPGLDGIYGRWLERQFLGEDTGPKRAAREAEYQSDIAPVLALIAIAATPMPETVIDVIMRGWQGDAWPWHRSAQVLQSLGHLFQPRDDAWSPFHKSLRDWLLSTRPLAALRVPVEDAKHHLARHLQAELDRAADARQPIPPGFARQEWAEKFSVFPALAHPVPPARQAAVFDCFILTIRALQHESQWSAGLVWCDMFERLANASASAPRAATPKPGLLQRLFGARRRHPPPNPNTMALRNASVANTERGDILTTMGQTEAATRAYENAHAIGKHLARDNPTSVEAQRDLSVSHERIGDMRAAQGDTAGALDAYGNSLAIRETLARTDPRNAEHQRDLSLSHSKIGNMRAAQGDTAGALDAYGNSLAIAETLARTDPGNAERQRDLSVSHNKIGDMRAAQGDTAGALDAYGKALAIAETLARTDPSNAERQRDLSVSHNKIGNMRAAQGDTAGALDAYGNSLAIAETLARADPSNAERRRDLSWSYTKLGEMRAAQDDPAGALDAFLKSLAIDEAMAKADPTNIVRQRDLFVSLFNVTRLLVAQADPTACASARRLHTQATLFAERFPQDRQREAYLQDAATLLQQACPPP